MSLRPAGVIPDFAATTNYPAGGDPWAGQPTKADPGSALIAQGFTPHALLAAEEMNWLLNKMGQWLRYQDTIEVQTWTELVDPSVIQNEPENCLIWSPQLWRYFIAGLHTDNTNGRVYSSINGVAWDDDGAPNSAGQYQVCGGAPSTLLVWRNSGATSTNYLRTAASTYTASANAAVQYQHVAVWISDRWVIGGVGATHPTMRTLNPADVQTTITLPGAGSVVGGIRGLATNGTAFVAILEGVDDVYSGTPTGTITHSTPTFSGSPTGIVYVAGEALYWLTTDTGSVYTSPTGTTWTLRYTASGFVFSGGYAVAVGAIASLGGLVVAAVLVTVPGGTVAGLAVGIDRGTTWTVYVSPVGSPSGAGTAALGIATLDNRLGFISRKGVTGSDGVRLAYSLRVLA